MSKRGGYRRVIFLIVLLILFLAATTITILAININQSFNSTNNSINKSIPVGLGVNISQNNIFVNKTIVENKTPVVNVTVNNTQIINTTQKELVIENITTNKTKENTPVVNLSVDVTQIHGKVIINNPVKWTKKIKSSVPISDYNVNLPAALSYSVVKYENGIKKSVTVVEQDKKNLVVQSGAADKTVTIKEEFDDLEIEYYTPGPIKSAE